MPKNKLTEIILKNNIQEKAPIMTAVGKASRTIFAVLPESGGQYTFPISQKNNESLKDTKNRRYYSQINIVIFISI